MLFECSLVALITCVIAALSVVGNRLGLWQSWFVCAAGAFTNVVLLNLAVTPSPFADGFLTAGFAALLWWIGRDNVTVSA